MTDVQARPALDLTNGQEAVQTDPLRTRVAERMLPKARYLSADMHRLVSCR